MIANSAMSPTSLTTAEFQVITLPHGPLEAVYVAVERASQFSNGSRKDTVVVQYFPPSSDGEGLRVIKPFRVICLQHCECMISCEGKTQSNF